MPGYIGVVRCGPTCEKRAYYYTRSVQRSRCSRRHRVGVEINGQYCVVLMAVVKKVTLFLFGK